MSHWMRKGKAEAEGRGECWTQEVVGVSSWNLVSHRVSPTFRESWEMQSHHVPRKKKEQFS